MRAGGLWLLAAAVAALLLLVSAEEASPPGDAATESVQNDLVEAFGKIEAIIASQRELAKELDGLFDLQEARLKALKSGGEIDAAALSAIRAKATGARAGGRTLSSSAASVRPPVGGADDESCGSAILEYGSAKMQKTIITNREQWTDHMKMLSTVAVDEEVSYIHALHQDGGNGVARYVAIGVVVGKVYVFRPNGELLVEYDTGSDHPVTQIFTVPIRRNETLVWTGHDDGGMIGHRLVEKVEFEPTLGEQIYSLNFTARYTLVPKGKNTDETAAGMGAISFMDSFKLNNRRFLLAADRKGMMHVYRENGTFVGATQTEEPIVLFRPLSSGTAILTEHGLAFMDPRTLKITARPCINLNGSSIIAAKTDTTVSTKVYALTQDGDMLQIFITGEKAGMRCNVKVRRPLGVTPSTTLGVIKSYLFLGTPGDVAIFNTTGTGRWGPKGVLQESLANMAGSYGIEVSGGMPAMPQMATNKQNLVTVGFGSGMVAFFLSELPVHKPADWNTKLWSQPIFIVAIVLVGVWQFYRQKTTSAYGRGGGGGGMEDMDYAKFEAAAKKLGGANWDGGGGMGGMGGGGGMGRMSGMR